MALHAGAAAALLIGQRRRDRGRASAVRRPPRRGGRPLLRPAGDRRLPVRAPDRAAPGRSARDGRRARSPERSRWRSPTAVLSCAGPVTPRPSTASPSGFGQATALAPGVSRNGATLAAARWRRFTAHARQPALAHRRPAGDRRRDPPQGGPASPSRRRARPRRGDGGRRGRVVRLHARLAEADRRWSSGTGPCGRMPPTGSAWPARCSEASPWPSSHGGAAGPAMPPIRERDRAAGG